MCVCVCFTVVNEVDISSMFCCFLGTLLPPHLIYVLKTLPLTQLPTLSRPMARHTVRGVCVCMCVCVETKGKYLWLPQPPIINPSFPPSPQGGTFQRSAVCRTVPEATLQERLLNPENQRCEYKSSTSHLCFWEKKTHPPVAPISLTVWIAHCAADYWFCFRPACVIAPESRLVIPAVKAINFMLAREHNLSVSHPTVWRSGSRHLHERVSYPKHKLCLY